MKHLVLGLALVAIVCTAPALAQRAKEPDTYIKVEVKGKLQTDVVAIGGETTGTVVHTRAGLLELDLTGDKKLAAVAKKLNGKTIIARGELTFVRGVTPPTKRNIVKVKVLEAANGK